MGWVESANCATTSPDAFFPEWHESYRGALQVCAVCPVITECLTEALGDEKQVGIRGGLTAAQRKKMLKDLVAA